MHILNYATHTSSSGMDVHKVGNIICCKMVWEK